ncbi:hypothetical protein [Ktedonospora formicarum]|uniref:hypothetical protein n=1 Tax=Ktedonospora formicarum TaxID=2778364 RepID=UPI001C68E203|nr:hypothetical protein [Ktedonospora formicarum]
MWLKRGTGAARRRLPFHTVAHRRDLPAITPPATLPTLLREHSVAAQRYSVRPILQDEVGEFGRVDVTLDHHGERYVGPALRFRGGCDFNCHAGIARYHSSQLQQEAVGTCDVGCAHDGFTTFAYVATGGPDGQPGGGHRLCP